MSSLKNKEHAIYINPDALYNFTKTKLKSSSGGGGGGSDNDNGSKKTTMI